ncbi:glycosyltransferase [Desulfohalovibrio reitneri]|uniref:glycosyltransferase family protein n=1 Tax=Desulfohalovibrio reitneri TaxID=1307759 RepID=UPI0004A6DB84|nr:glycosyltransferase [Desulfohalovibrio reitneri]
MTKMVWLGTPGFAGRMRDMGYEVTHVPLERPEVLDWSGLCQRAGCEPEVVVYSDRSFPPPLAGLESFPALTCFYCVDSHIHGWYPAYARAFDCCALSLRDHLPRFAAELSVDRVAWLPPYPKEWHKPDWEAEKEWDVLFAGHVDPSTTPRRHVFLAEMSRLLGGGLHITTGAYAELFPKARVVLNVAERGDLNFRVFEALACGACLLTPEVGHGQSDLFHPGVHLQTYANLDPADAAAKASALLADPAGRKAMARAGNAEVEANHRQSRRAETLDGLLRSEAAREARRTRPDRAEELARGLRVLCLHWAESLEDGDLRRAYLRAAGVSED